MRYQKGYTIIEQIVVTVFVVFVGSWFINMMKFANCDFKSGANTDWKCEAIHGVGLIPGISAITMWFGTDAE